MSYFQASLIAERTGHWVLARSYAERAKAIYEELRDQANVGKLLNEIGALNFQLGKPEDAVTYLKEAFKVLLDVGDDVDAGRVISSLAQVHLRTGKIELAEEQAREALGLLDGRVDHVDEIGNAQLVLGRSLLEQDRLDEAELTLSPMPSRASTSSRRSATARPPGSPKATSRPGGGTTPEPPHFTAGRRKRFKTFASELDFCGKEVKLVKVKALLALTALLNIAVLVGGHFDGH